MNLLQWNERGQSLIQVIIAVGIMGILMLGMTALFEIFNKQQSHSNLAFQAGMVRNSLVSALNNPVGWRNTATQSANNFSNGVMLDCVNNGQPCTTDQTTDLAAGGTPVGYSGGVPTDDGVLIRQVLDSTGVVILDSTNANSGFTPQGTPCSTFNGTAGAGDDSCPLRYEVRWWAKCNSVVNTCINAQPELQVVAIYNPRKQGHAFNPMNYGTPKFLQGQEPGGLCWQLVGTLLYENCADGVGIGTTNPNFPLTLRRSVATNDTYSMLADFGGGTDATLGSMRIGLGVYPSATGANRHASIYAGDSSALRSLILNYNGTAFGNVGIGTTTARTPLEVYDWGFGGAQIRTTNNSSTRTSGIDFFSTGASAYGFVGYRGVGSAAPAVEGLWLSAGDNFPLIFGTTLLPGPSTERMRITPSGNVGIGTTAAVNPLTVFSRASGGTYLSIRTPGTATQQQAGLNLVSLDRGTDLGSGTDVGWNIGAYSASHVLAASRNDLRIEHYNGSSWSTPMTIDSITGNVGIGTPSPNQRLEVNGNVAAQGFFYTSDKRAKTNIVPLGKSGSVLERLDSLHGVYFDWKKSGEKSIGIIAQDVARDFPELVDRRDDQHWTVNYGGLVAVVLEALKELHEFVVGSMDKIAALEQQNQMLKSELSNLRAEVGALLRASAKAKEGQR